MAKTEKCPDCGHDEHGVYCMDTTKPVHCRCKAGMPAKKERAMMRKKGRVLKSGHTSKYSVLMYIPPNPDQEFMRQEAGRLLTLGLRGVVNVSGRLKVTIAYDGKGK